jgi:hypothetical protein
MNIQDYKNYYNLAIVELDLEGVVFNQDLSKFTDQEQEQIISKAKELSQGMNKENN